MNPYYWQRECGRYTLDVARMDTSASGQRWTAWRRAPSLAAPAINLGCKDWMHEALELVREDLAEHGERE